MTTANNKITARIFKIESLNTHNGPGYRTVIYFKGCPLKCEWCHNPESISSNKEIWILNNKCIKCSMCIENCPTNALSLKPEGIFVDRNKCTGCYKCSDICPSKAIEKIGINYTVDELYNQVINDKAFWDNSGGGITFTGGEPGLYPDFLQAFIIKCKANNIHTAFDSSGFISKNALQKIIPYVDLIFFDLKIMNNEKAKKLTGQNTEKILDNLNYIKNLINKNEQTLEIRTPIIPYATDDQTNLSHIARILNNNFTELINKWELCLFNDICEDKYQKMNKHWNYTNKNYKSLNIDWITQFQKDNCKLNIELSGFLSK